MKIGIVSDSHKKIGLLESALNILKDNGAEFIIHAGDIVLEESLELLKSCGLPYQAVFGNNDMHLIKLSTKFNIKAEPCYFKIGDMDVKLMHHPFYLNGDTSLVIFGHTHYFECELKNNTLYINPGEICARKKPVSEFALIEADDKKWIVTHYEKDMLNENSTYTTKVLTL